MFSQLILCNVQQYNTTLIPISVAVTCTCTSRIKIPAGHVTPSKLNSMNIQSQQATIIDETFKTSFHVFRQLTVHLLIIWSYYFRWLTGHPFLLSCASISEGWFMSWLQDPKIPAIGISTVMLWNATSESWTFVLYFYNFGPFITVKWFTSGLHDSLISDCWQIKSCDVIIYVHVVWQEYAFLFQFQ